MPNRTNILNVARGAILFSALLYFMPTVFSQKVSGASMGPCLGEYFRIGDSSMKVQFPDTPRVGSNANVLNLLHLKYDCADDLSDSTLFYGVEMYWQDKTNFKGDSLLLFSDTALMALCIQHTEFVYVQIQKCKLLSKENLSFKSEKAVKYRFSYTSPDPAEPYSFIITSIMFVNKGRFVKLFTFSNPDSEGSSTNKCWFESVRL